MNNSQIAEINDAFLSHQPVLQMAGFSKRSMKGLRAGVVSSFAFIYMFLLSYSSSAQTF
jgi:hypothetical protein